MKKQKIKAQTDARALIRVESAIEKLCKRFNPVAKAPEMLNGEVKIGDVYPLIHGSFLVVREAKGRPEITMGSDSYQWGKDERAFEGVYIAGEFRGYGIVGKRVVIPELALQGVRHHHLTSKDYRSQGRER